MNADIITRLTPPTPEERALLQGQPLLRESYMAGHSAVIDSQKLLEPKQLITLRPHTRFVDFPMHRHNYVEMLYMLSGSTLHTMGDGQTVRLEAGDLLLFSRRAAHAIAKASAEDIAVNFIILPPFFNVALDMIGANNALGRFVIDTLCDADSAPAYLHFRVRDVPAVQCVLESMVYSLLEPDVKDERIDQTAMGLLFMHLLEHTADIAAPVSAGRTHALVIEALREIETGYQTADFTALARARGVSMAYLSRIVRQATGKTCKQLLQEKRVDMAVRLLKTSGMTVTEICQAVGYSNTSYFYHLMQRQTGQSPKLLREVK